MVADAVELAEDGYSPQAIARQYRGAISAEAVSEALELVRKGIVKEIESQTQTAA